MKLSDRRRHLKLPYDNAISRALGLARLTRLGMSPEEASRRMNRVRERALRTPLRGERCEAHARSTGQPCQAPAMANGRCKLHGGKSTGAKSTEGQRRAYGWHQEQGEDEPE